MNRRCKTPKTLRRLACPICSQLDAMAMAAVIEHTIADAPADQRRVADAWVRRAIRGSARVHSDPRDVLAEIIPAEVARLAAARAAVFRVPSTAPVSRVSAAITRLVAGSHVHV